MLVGTRNIRPSELAQPAKHGLPYTPVPAEYEANAQRVAEQAQLVRDQAGPVRVISGYRSPAYNAAVDGAPSSLHLTASAIDLAPIGYSVERLKSAVIDLLAAGKLQIGGLGFYRWGVHLDVRPSDEIVTWDPEARAALAAIGRGRPGERGMAGAIAVGALALIGWLL